MENTSVFFLLWKDFKILYFKRKKYMILLIVLIMLIIGTSFYENISTKIGYESKVRLGVVDHDNSTYSTLLLDYFQNNETFRSYIELQQGTESELQELLMNKQLDCTIVIPEGFAQNLIHLVHDPIHVSINISDRAKSIVIKNILQSYEKYIQAVEIGSVGIYEILLFSGANTITASEINESVSIDLIVTALGKDSFFEFHEVKEYPSTNYSLYYMFDVLCISLTYLSIYIGFQMLKERRTGMSQRMLLLGITSKTMLLEKILLTFIPVFIVLCTFSLSFSKIVDINQWMKYMIFFIMFSFVCYLFFVLLSALCSTESNYMIVSNLLAFYGIVLGGGIVPISLLPWNLARFAIVTPNYWFIKTALLIDNGMDLFFYIIIIFLLVVLSVLFYLLTVRFYGREET